MAVQTIHRAGLSREEKIGLAVALAAHVALVVWLWLEPLGKAIQPPPERMTVNLSEEIAPEATSPEPMAQAAPDLAPELGEAQPEPEPVAAPPPPEPAPKVVASPLPRPVPKPVVKPVAKAPPKPAPPVAKAPPKPAAKAAPRPVAKPAAKTPADERPRRRPDAKPGGNRVGDDFLKGISGANPRGTAQTPPAARAGPQVAASLSQAISRQLKPRWVAPQGAEADQLVTVLAFDLNPDGSLAGRPRVISQSGVTEANAAQKSRHAEQAIRAVQLAAPFDLPEQYYPLWKRVASFRFDRRLSQ